MNPALGGLIIFSWWFSVGLLTLLWHYIHTLYLLVSLGKPPQEMKLDFLLGLDCHDSGPIPLIFVVLGPVYFIGYSCWRVGRMVYQFCNFSAIEAGKKEWKRSQGLPFEASGQLSIKED